MLHLLAVLLHRYAESCAPRDAAESAATNRTTHQAIDIVLVLATQREGDTTKARPWAVAARMRSRMLIWC